MFVIITVYYYFLINKWASGLKKDLCEYEDDAQADLASEMICYILCSDKRSGIDRRVACILYVPAMTCDNSINNFSQQTLAVINYRQL